MTLKTRATCNSRLVAALILLGGLSSPAQTQAARVLKHESERNEFFHYEGGVFLPMWEGGALLDVVGNNSDEPVIFGIDRDGQMERFGFSVSGGRYILLAGLSRAKDGSIAAIGSAYSSDGQPVAFLARITPDRSRKTIVQLWPYVGLAVTFSPDGGMWTVGYVKPPDNLGISEYNVLRRFDPSGKLLATARVEAQGLYTQGRNAATDSLMRVSKDRVGWLTNASEYIEFAIDGRELGRFPPPPGPPPEVFEATLALSDANEVLVGTRAGDRLKVWSLDRKERSWKPVELSGGRPLAHGATLGFDGDTVVAIDGRHISGATVSRYALSPAQ